MASHQSTELNNLSGSSNKGDGDFIISFLKALSEEQPDEKSDAFYEEFVKRLVHTADSCSIGHFESIISWLSAPLVAAPEEKDASSASVATASSAEPSAGIASAGPSSPVDPHAPKPTPIVTTSTATEPAPQSRSNIATIGLVKIFLRLLEKSAWRAQLVFDKLISIAISTDHPKDARLSALRLLFRIRSDSEGRLYVVPSPDNEYLVNIFKPPVEKPVSDSASRGNVTETNSPTSEESPASGPPKPASKESRANSSSQPLRSSVQSQQSRTAAAPAWSASEPMGLPVEPSPNCSIHGVAFVIPEATPTSPEAEDSGRQETTGETEVAEVQSPPPDKKEEKVVFKINLWIEAIIMLLQRERDWDVYSYVLVNLAPQLMNRQLFQHGAVLQIQLLRSVLCEQIRNEQSLGRFEFLGVKKSDVVVCIYQTTTMLIAFHGYFAKSEQDELVRCFMLGIGSWEGTSRGCIHSLAICCHEIPRSVAKCLIAILDRMTRIITQPQIAVHILEFLSMLAHLPHVFVNFREAEIRPIFGICIRFIQTSREKRLREEKAEMAAGGGGASSRPTSTYSSRSSDVPPHSASRDLPNYVYRLAYNVIIYWFLSLKLDDRVNHVNWLTKSLICKGENGRDVIEEESEVLIDMMQRAVFSDLGDTMPYEKFPPSDSDGPVNKKSWIVGNSILTIETAGTTGLSQIVKRQASGTTYASYQQRTAPTLSHQIPTDYHSHLLPTDTSETPTLILPSHVLLQLTASAFPKSPEDLPIPLPDDEPTRRAIRTFDRNDVLDGYKIGVIYIGQNQTKESEILANTKGSVDYEYFLQGLGTKIPLRNAKINTQGLSANSDGEYAYAWRDRTTEIVYHIATMMPTDLENDPQCINKKRHVGNDFVNVIYNRSNRPFDINTIASQFNNVNIIVTPVARIPEDVADEDYDETKTYRQCDDDSSAETTRSACPDDAFKQTYFIVKTLTQPNVPNLTAADTPKVISAKTLPAFIRLVAMNAAFYSAVTSALRGEHVSSWKNRLREIKRLRNRLVMAAREDSGNPQSGTTAATAATPSAAVAAVAGGTSTSTAATSSSSATATSSSGVATTAIPLTREDFPVKMDPSSFSFNI